MKDCDSALLHQILLTYHPSDLKGVRIHRLDQGKPGANYPLGQAHEAEVVGETPNLVARLQALADPDTVVIDSNTRSLLGDLFEYRALIF